MGTSRGCTGRVVLCLLDCTIFIVDPPLNEPGRVFQPPPAGQPVSCIPAVPKWPSGDCTMRRSSILFATVPPNIRQGTWCEEWTYNWEDSSVGAGSYFPRYLPVLWEQWWRHLNSRLFSTLTGMCRHKAWRRRNWTQKWNPHPLCGACRTYIL